jgi:hypothetical protein
MDLFKDQYEQLGLSLLDRTIASQFIYEVIMTTNLNTYILTEKLTKYSFKNSEKTKGLLIAELILTEVLKTFQPNGHLVFLVSLTSYLIQNQAETGDDYKEKIQMGLERLTPYVSDISITGLENLASWYSHLKTNKNISTTWLKPLRQTEKGKFLIGKIFRNIVQLSQYRALSENPGFAEFIDYFPAEPKLNCTIIHPGHQRHSDYQLLLDKLSQELSGEQMAQFLNSNELSCYGSELQDLFIQTLLEKSQ